MTPASVVSPVPSADRAAALGLLLSHLPGSERVAEVRRLIGEAERGGASLDGLLWAVQDDRPVGATLIVPATGGVAFVWPPVGHDAATAETLLEAGCRWLDQQGLRFGQCLVDVDDTITRTALARHGYVRQVVFLFLRRSLSRPVLHADPGELSGEPADEEGLEGLLERTWVGTRDCPELCRLRTAAEAIASMRSVGEFDAGWWWRYRDRRGRDVGVLLINRLGDDGCGEVVYLGVVPEMRGSGHGRTIMADGLTRARNAGWDAIQLAVDRRNDVARAIYQVLGFRETARQALCVRVTPSTDS